jgi:hypothetical protein
VILSIQRGGQVSRRDVTRIRGISLVFTLTVVLVARAAADEPKGNFEVHDFSLWILESPGLPANARNMFASALPPTVNSQRMTQEMLRATSRSGGVIVAAPQPVLIGGGNAQTVGIPQQPSSTRRMAPFGLITFHGTPATNLDVDLRAKAGSFVGHWPPAESLPNRLRWFGGPQVDLVAKLDDESELCLVDDEHWFKKARAAENLYVHRGARAERFLAYDAETNLPSPIKLEGGPDKYTVANASGVRLYDVLIARSTPEGLRVAWLDELPGGEPPKPAAKPPVGAKPAQDLFGDGKGAKGEAATEAPAAEAKPTEPKADQPAEQPAAQPANENSPAAVAKRLARQGLLPKSNTATKTADGNKPAGAPTAKLQGVEVTLSNPLAAGSDELRAHTTASLTDRLTRAGLTASEAELMTAHYAPLLFQGEGVIIACRLDAGAIDEKLPLSIFPEPSKVVRVPMVVMRNADPQLGGQVEGLVAQLGDPKYKVREAAQQRLMELGPLAFPALNKALNHNDLEVVIRAEKILLHHNQQAAGRQGATNPQPAGSTWGLRVPAAPAAPPDPAAAK